MQNKIEDLQERSKRKNEDYEQKKEGMKNGKILGRLIKLKKSILKE